MVSGPFEIERPSLSKLSYGTFCHGSDISTKLQASGSIEEGKKYFSGKHKLYGYKVEVSVLPCGLALGARLHEPGSVSDLVIFQQMQSFHRKQLRKTSEEADIFDEGPLSERYPNHWAVLTDKGYQGGQEFCRVIHPTRKPPRGVLTPAEVAENHHISSDRIIVENFFGRVCGLWNVLSSKWKWAEKNYDAVFRLCLGLTNFHISRKPLRAADAILYQQVTNRWYKIGTSQSERRRRIKKNYREKRQSASRRGFRAGVVADQLGRQPSEDW